MSTTEFERGLEAHQARAEAKSDAEATKAEAQLITKELASEGKISAYEWYQLHKLRVFQELHARIALAEDYLLQPDELPEEWDRIFTEQYAQLQVPKP